MAIAALITWVITAGFGFFMLSTWVTKGGLRGDTGVANSHFPAANVFGHFLLAAAGLVIWIVYLVTAIEVLTWVAFTDLVIVAILGELLVTKWAKDRRAVSAIPGSGASPAATDLAEQHIPVAVVALHGLFAVTTVVLVLLTALGVGAS